MIDWSAIFALNGQLVLVRIVAVLLLVALHGASLAWLARLLGDRGPEHDGRLTLNPLQHLDSAGALVPLFFRFGWIRPVAVDPAALRGGAAGMALIVAGSLLVLLLAAAGLWQLRPLLLSANSAMAVTLVGGVEVLCDLALHFAAINLLPLPPLTAGMMLAAWAPALHARLMRWVLPLSLALALAVALGGGAVLAPVVDALRGILLP